MADTTEILTMILLVAGMAGCDSADGAGGAEYTADGCPIGYAVGECGADFTLPDQEGVLWTLSALQGAPVVLDFSAVWCEVCQAFTPELEGLAARWQDDGGAQVLHIIIQDADGSAPTVETVAAWAERFGLTIPVLADVDEAVKEDYRPLRGLPATFVLDAGGVITFSHNGTDGLVEGIDAALGL